ncbi:MAG: flagellar hook-length control protein FliK [Actinomycetota bacterium]|nr:flagellar hook-length control protein FliK [Actinomycetota bacterium]
MTAVWRRATVPGATVGARGGSTEGGSASGAARLASSARLLAPVAGRQASEARGATSQPTGATAEAGSRVSEPPPSFGSAWTPADGLPSGTAAQARQLDMPGVAAQLVRVISVPRVTAEGTYTVQVVLHPVELGEVSARITARESGLSVHLVAASDLGTEALQRALPELRTALSAFGTKTTVTLGTRRAHGTGRSSSWPTGDGTGAGTRGGGAQPRRGSGLGPEPTPRAGMLGPVDPLGPPPPRSERPRGRTGNVLDVRV